MPHLKSPSRGQVARGGYHNDRDIGKQAPQAIPRDDLRTAFAGDENKGPKAREKVRHGGSHLKGRRIAKDSGKTPVR